MLGMPYCYNGPAEEYTPISLSHTEHIEELIRVAEGRDSNRDGLILGKLSDKVAADKSGTPGHQHHGPGCHGQAANRLVISGSRTRRISAMAWRT